MKRIFKSLLLCLFCFAPLAGAEPILVAVAANAQYAFKEIEAQFEKDTGMDIEVFIGSSGKFAAQIQNDAPFDVFLSADAEYPEALEKAGFTAEPPRVYGYGTLVLWSVSGLDLNQGLKILTDPSVHKVAIASPKAAPYGRAAVAVLKYYGLFDAVEPKLVYGESLGQVSSYITAKVADAGMTAMSLVLAPEVKDKGRWVEVPKESYKPIEQKAAWLKHGRQTKPEQSKKLYDYLFSRQARAIFAKYGYDLP